MLVEYARELGAKPKAQIIGGGFKTSVAEAAYVNGSLAHADELESYGSPPGAGLIPPLAAGLTVGDFKNSSDRDYITAVLAGTEMQGRLGMSGIGACDAVSWESRWSGRPPPTTCSPRPGSCSPWASSRPRSRCCGASPARRPPEASDQAMLIGRAGRTDARPLRG